MDNQSNDRTETTIIRYGVTKHTTNRRIIHTLITVLQTRLTSCFSIWSNFIQILIVEIRFRHLFQQYLEFGVLTVRSRWAVRQVRYLKCSLEMSSSVCSVFELFSLYQLVGQCGLCGLFDWQFLKISLFADMFGSPVDRCSVTLWAIVLESESSLNSYSWIDGIRVRATLVKIRSW